ncbi:MAG: type II toxin-antitoxin system HicB family antitoxin [Chloroflexi bacterium]|nr:type II toxin-antitoxin system HicB family antitoxin [Chloroflexota bacterium]
MKHAVVIEWEPQNSSAFDPDLPGCVATGEAQEEVTQNIHQAIASYLVGTRKDGIPSPQASTMLIEVQTQSVR